MREYYIYYYGTKDPILLGDRIIFRKFFSRVRGTVVYLPGQSRENKDLGSEVWGIKLDTEPGDVRTMGFFPEHDKFAIKKISLISRGSTELDIRPELKTRQCRSHILSS